MKVKNKVNIIGAGLSGSESALYLLKHGYDVTLYEMRPEKQTGAHLTGNVAELVCSNSLKSEVPGTASGLLKAELDLLDCSLLKLARLARVPAGSSLAVDREKFSSLVETELEKYENFTLVREEIKTIDKICPTIIATGPLTSNSLCETLIDITGDKRLYFYDAIAPIVDFSSIDMNYAYFGGRYGDGEDYLNLPMERDEYEKFYNELINAESVTLREFEKSELFSSCMPIEIMAKRGSDTMRFGPLKPVGLRDPKTNKSAYAVVQLRKENLDGNCYNLVGFQTNLKFQEQKRVFSMIPALHDAEFIRYGQMHRNTYINAPGVLDSTFKVIGQDNLYIAGQLSGVEGYVESIMSGLISAISLDRELNGLNQLVFPKTTIIGALTRYISKNIGEFNPMNANFGILPMIDTRNKKARKQMYYERGVKDMQEYIETMKK